MVVLKRVWCRYVGHTKVKVCDEKEASQGDFNRVHIHEEKRVDIE